MKIYDIKNATITHEKTTNGYYLVKLRIGTELRDKILTDCYKSSLAYVKAFKKIAKNI